MKGAMDHVVVHELQSAEQCAEAARVCALAMPATVRAAGQSVDSWAWLLCQRLLRSRQLWSQYGIAKDGETVVGVVLVKLCGDNAARVGCAEACCQVGCYRSLRAAWTKRVAGDTFLEVNRNSVYIETLAVRPDYQRHRIASKLLEWVEAKGLDLLMERFPEDIRAKGSRLVAEVGMENEAGIACFEAQGYLCSSRTDKDTSCTLCLEDVMRCALGHTVFVTMTKRLSAAYQRAVQQPVNYVGTSVIVHIPDPEQPMSRK